MANPIKKIKRMEIPKEKIQQDNLNEIIDAVSDNKDAILSGIDLLTTLHDSGLIDMINALVKRKDDAMYNIMTELNKSQYAGALENISPLIYLLNDLKLDEASQWITKLNQGITAASEVSDDTNKTSYMDLLRALQDPEINRSITMLLQFLRGMGREE